MARSFILVMDSLGIGAAPDAGRFGDAGANTLGHIAAQCAQGLADRQGLRSGPLVLPNLCEAGLAKASELATGSVPAGLDKTSAKGQWGAAREKSLGKDTPSGHWEMMGVPVLFDWHYFPQSIPTFPDWLTDGLQEKFGLPGFLGNCHASGTDIIRRHGIEHIRTGKPIVYTSADSVFQIAAHEGSFGLDRLYEICEFSRDMLDSINVGRVIARPFTGEGEATFVRTGNRKDYSVPPPAPTLLQRASAEGRHVMSIGKIGDIFAHLGTGTEVKANGHQKLWEATAQAAEQLEDGGIAMTNFVDFDQLYGHRRDVIGYAAALEEFDRQLPRFMSKLKEGDLVIITADHGCDPTAPGSDHTREFVPVLCLGPAASTGCIGVRDTFADIAATVEEHIGVSRGASGTSWFGSTR